MNRGSMLNFVSLAWLKTGRREVLARGAAVNLKLSKCSVRADKLVNEGPAYRTCIPLDKGDSTGICIMIPALIEGSKLELRRDSVP